MKRLYGGAIFIALVCFAFFAMADMNVCSDAVLSETRGEAGINLDLSLRTTDGYMAYGDSDGFTGYTGQGYLSLTSIIINNGAGTNLTWNNIQIDSGTAGANVGVVAVALGNMTGDVSIDQIKLGNTVNGGSKVGSLTVGDLTFTSTSRIFIGAH